MRIITLHSSGIKAYLQCPHRWKLGFHESLRLTGGKRLALDKGTCMHKLLELYYINRLDKSPRDAGIAAMETYLTLPERDLIREHQYDITVRFGQYIMKYGTDDFQPIKLNGIPSTEVGFTHVFYEDETCKYILEGKFDLFSYIGKDLVFADHKTQGRYSELYQWIPQFLTYAMVSGLKKMVINYVGFQKEVTDRTLRRSLVTFPDWKINNWRLKVLNIFQEIHRRLDYLEQHPNIPQIFTQNESSCGGAFDAFHCQFTHLCEIDQNNQMLVNNIKKFKYSTELYESWYLEAKDLEDIS